MPSIFFLSKMRLYRILTVIPFLHSRKLNYQSILLPFNLFNFSLKDFCAQCLMNLGQEVNRCVIVYPRYDFSPLLKHSSNLIESLGFEGFSFSKAASKTALKQCRGQDSNLRSFTQRILSPPPLTAREPRLVVVRGTLCF